MGDYLAGTQQGFRIDLSFLRCTKACVIAWLVTSFLSGYLQTPSQEKASRVSGATIKLLNDSSFLKLL